MKINTSFVTLIMRAVITLMVILVTVLVFLVLIKVIIPPANRDAVIFASGVILSGGWPQVIKWWFPSDINSERKTELIAKAESIKE